MEIAAVSGEGGLSRRCLEVEVGSGIALVGGERGLGRSAVGVEIAPNGRGSGM